MYDYLLVGFGLSGAALAHRLEEKGKSFVVFDGNGLSASHVAGGIYNPVILKRFTLAWNAAQQLETAVPFYQSLEKKLGVPLQKNISVYRKFASIEEQNNWFAAAENPSLQAFLDDTLVKHFPGISAPFQLGKVNHIGMIDIAGLLQTFKKRLLKKGQFRSGFFDYSAFKISENTLHYQDIQTRHIVFCEGFGMEKNPFFNYLPLRGNKGEFLIIRAPELQMNAIVKSTFFIIPLGKDLYKVGATYDPQDLSPEPTHKAETKLTRQLDQLLECEYNVVGRETGIRPVVPDRRPLVGRHPKHKNLLVCNGFGSRGVLIAPTVTGQLIDFIENEKPLPQEINCNRFG